MSTASLPDSANRADAIVEKAIAGLLRRIPTRWEKHDPDELTETECQAMYLLSGAGLVERRFHVRGRMVGHPVAFEATFACTGGLGIAEALQGLVANAWEQWRGAYEAWKVKEAGATSPFVWERIGLEEWRLTSHGEQALSELNANQTHYLFDFVLRRANFRLQPWPNGKGVLVRLERTQADAQPASVNLANWEAGAQAFATAFEKMYAAQAEQLKSMAEALQTNLPHLKHLANIPENAATKETRENAAFASMGEAVKCAYWSFTFACQENNHKPMSDRDAYDWYEQWSKTKAAREARGIPELDGYKLPRFDTWTRQLRDARKAVGEQKNTPRADRPTGKSVVSQHQVEPQFYSFGRDDEEDDQD